MNTALLAIFFLGAVVFLLTLFLIFDVWITFAKFAPFSRSNRRKIKIMFELAAVKPGEVVIDLGSGDGTLVFEAARRGARAIGIEINPLLVWISRWRAQRQNVRDKVTIVRGDVQNYPLHDADVIFLYLMPRGMSELRSKFVSEAKKGSRIVSNSFLIPDMMPLKEVGGVYLYRM